MQAQLTLREVPQIVDDDFLYDADRLWEFIALIRSHNIQDSVPYGSDREWEAG